MPALIRPSCVRLAQQILALLPHGGRGLPRRLECDIALLIAEYRNEVLRTVVVGLRVAEPDNSAAKALEQFIKDDLERHVPIASLNLPDWALEALKQAGIE